MVLAAGVYQDRDQAHLLEGPLWNHLEIEGADPSRERRVLNLRSGVLTSEQPGTGGVVTSTWFNPVDHPGVRAMRAEGPPGVIHRTAALQLPPPAEGVRSDRGVDPDRAWSTVTGPSGAGIGAVASEQCIPAAADGVETLQRLAVYVADGYQAPPLDGAFDELSEVERVGFDDLLSRQRAGWVARWSDAEISIEGDPEVELGARFAIFHLLSSVADTGEAAVGARGLSGPSYGGHVFWDADVFVLPALAAIRPRAARAMLEYRLRRLAVARRGWPSPRGCAGRASRGSRPATATTSRPGMYRVPDGTAVPIRTGQHEEHIVADVAWAAWDYSRGAVTRPSWRGRAGHSWSTRRATGLPGHGSIPADERTSSG